MQQRWPRRSNDAHASGLAPPRRILIVEDNDDGREALRLQLQIAGHEVHGAATGPEGIKMAASLKPDVVLLDIGLPGLDGYQVAEHMRAAGDGASADRHYGLWPARRS